MKTYLKDLTAKEIIRRLKNGEIAISESNKLIKYKLIDGILCEVGERYPNVIGATISPYDNLYFETEEPFEIKETGLYKTRDGRKAFASKIYDTGHYPVFGIIEGEDKSINWSTDGSVPDRTCCTDYARYEHNEDIISKWKD